MDDRQIVFLEVMGGIAVVGLIAFLSGFYSGRDSDSKMEAVHSLAWSISC